MSAENIGIIVVCSLVGYWVASALIDAWSARQKARPQEQDAPTDEWWTVLKVSRNASLEEVQEAYRTQISQYHPDKVARLGDEIKAVAEKKSKEINSAYETAMQEKARRPATEAPEKE